MKVGFTGTRNRMTNNQKARFLCEIQEIILLNGITEFHHGCCVGSDTEAVVMMKATDATVTIVAHRPKDGRFVGCTAIELSNKMKEARPYLVRNHNIVDETDILIATPDGPERIRSGTWATVRYARNQGKRVIILMPDGQEWDK